MYVLCYLAEHDQQNSKLTETDLWDKRKRQPHFCCPVLAHLFQVISQEFKFPGNLAPGKLAAVVVHAPGAAKGEGCPTDILVQSLACTRPPEEEEKGKKMVSHWK